MTQALREVARAELHDPRKTFGKAVQAVAEKNEKVVVLSTDSGGSAGLTDFMNLHPERYFEFGIEEQGATGVAAGFATMGLIPIYSAIAPFVTCRNYEQFRNDIGYMEQNVKIVGRNGGVTYADLGATHHSLEDYAIVRMIPGITILSPQDPAEIEAAVSAMVEHDGPVYMRIGNAALPNVIPNPEEFEIGKGVKLREGTRATVVSTGYITVSALEAVDQLESQGLEVDLIGLGTVVPLDEKLILESARQTGLVITIEEHYEKGGLSGIMAELLARTGVARLRSIAVPHNFVSAGPYEDVMKKLRLDPVGISEQIKEAVDE